MEMAEKGVPGVVEGKVGSMNVLPDHVYKKYRMLKCGCVIRIKDSVTIQWCDAHLEQRKKDEERRKARKNGKK